MLPGQALIYLFQIIDAVDFNHLAQDLIQDLQDLKKPLFSMKDLLTAVPNRKGKIFTDDEEKLCRVKVVFVYYITNFCKKQSFQTIPFVNTHKST